MRPGSFRLGRVMEAANTIGQGRNGRLAFVEKLSKEGSPDFGPVPEPIATFVNDGTLWCEKPMPVPLFFAIDRVKALAPQHPEWKDKELFAQSSSPAPTGAGGGRAALSCWSVVQ